MITDQKLIQRLISLIGGSTSISETEKAQMIQDLPQVAESEILAAIQIFEEEKGQLEALKIEGDHFLKQVKAFSKNSQHELEKKAKQLISQREIDLENIEGVEADNLLKTL